MNYTTRISSVAALSLGALLTLARGQVANPPAPADATPAKDLPAATTPGEPEVQMQQYNVNDVPIAEQILPTSRPFASVYGFDDDILSIPRNVTIVSRAQMDAIDMQDVTQFSELTSSSYTDSNYGSAANPSIRGQTADNFINGMRQHVGYAGEGMPIDFNSVESINIVPGPATAVQGASGYVGGYVDMITKQPFFDGTHGFASFTAGSYGTYRWTLDQGGPITPKLAYRFSYSGEDSDGYWYQAIRQTTQVYGALAYRPNSAYDLLLTVSAFWADYQENFGIDRPTQALISNGLYQSGTNVNNGTMAGPGNLQNALNIGGGPNGTDVIAWGPVVPVDYREIVQGPAGHTHGQEYNWQAIQTFKVSTDLKVVNNTYYSYLKRDIFNSDGYNEIDDPTWFIDNRTEMLFTLGKSELNVGLEERYLHVLEYTNFFFQPVNVWDLSSTAYRSDINYTLSTYFPETYGNAPIPGWPGRVGTQGIVNNDSNQSDSESVSPFIQGTWNVTPRLALDGGARMDFMHMAVKDPLTPDTSADLGVGEPNANLSLVYKVTPTVSTYATVNYSENYTGDVADGGGFSLYTDANTGLAALPRGLFSEESTLLEYGWKFLTDDSKLFVTTDVFHQTRQNKPQGQPVINYIFYGFEISANYQPNRNFFATVGYSWINGYLPASSFPYQSYDTQQIPGGPPDPNTDPGAYQATGNLRAPGQPLDLANALAQYTFDNGIGLEVNGVLTSPMNNDYYGYLVIPWQYSVDATVSYKTKNWQIRVTGSNLTNQHNWQPQVPTYALEAIVSQPAFECLVTLKYKF
jgi:catecholate siderophore receptor